MTEDHADRWHVIKNNLVQKDHVNKQHVIWNFNTEDYADEWHVIENINMKDYDNGYHVTDITCRIGIIKFCDNIKQILYMI